MNSLLYKTIKLMNESIRGEGKEPVWKDGREGDVNEEKEGEEQIGLNYTFYLTPQLPSDTTLLGNHLKELKKKKKIFRYTGCSTKHASW